MQLSLHKQGTLVLKKKNASVATYRMDIMWQRY